MEKGVPKRPLWWQTEIIYQIYPRSFQDSDGDGVGDLQGILQRLDYLQWLGIKAIWISPIFPSPMADFGYDISDYRDIHPLFGSMKDFDKLLEEVHGRGMKLILDLVPNHSSDQHPWFLESKSSRDNPKRDWYIWKDPRPDGSEPNNWLAMFGGSAWEWDEQTQQFYYHAFLKEQPDLNWRNPEVQKAMLDTMRFWLDKGVDGFRVDVMWHMIKDDHFRENPENPDYKDEQADYNRLIPAYSTDQPEVHGIVRQMRKVLDGYKERVMIGEIYLPISKLVSYYGTNNDEAHLPFNFLLLDKPWNARQIATAIDEYEGALPPDGWPNWVLGNHDQARVASRMGTAQARVATLLLLTLRGTPTLYYGDEIGMENVPIPEDEIQDPQGLNMPGKNLSRDPYRTPMQWDDSKNAGFSTGKPWLRLAGDYERDNVAGQQEDPSSMISFTKNLISIRQKEPALHMGSYTPVPTEGPIISYIREVADSAFLVLLNLSHDSQEFHPNHLALQGTVVIGTDQERDSLTLEGSFKLKADEGVLVKLEKW